MNKRVTAKTPKIKIVFASEYFEVHSDLCSLGCRYEKTGKRAFCVVKCAVGQQVLKRELQKDMAELDSLRNQYQERLNHLDSVELPSDTKEAV